MLNYDAIFFLGRSGAGKGTQAKLLSGRLGFFYWEMGGILRKEIERKTPVGQEVADLLAQGVLLSDEYLIKVLRSHMDEVSTIQGIVFDGVPRRPSQAKYLAELLKNLGRARLATIFLAVPTQESVERLHHRALVEHRLDDASEAAIHLRMEQFESETMPTAEYLKTASDFYEIDGTPDVEVVEAAIVQVLGLTP